MTHTMNLYPAPFEKIRRGKKTIELRVYDEKRRRIQAGDTICFRLEGDVVIAKVKAMHIFPDFEALYAALPLDQCGYAEEELASASPDDMLAYYTKSQIRKCGVVGIEIEVEG